MRAAEAEAAATRPCRNSAQRAANVDLRGRLDRARRVGRAGVEGDEQGIVRESRSVPGDEAVAIRGETIVGPAGENGLAGLPVVEIHVGDEVGGAGEVGGGRIERQNPPVAGNGGIAAVPAGGRLPAAGSVDQERLAPLAIAQVDLGVRAGAGEIGGAGLKPDEAAVTGGRATSPEGTAASVSPCIAPTEIPAATTPARRAVRTILKPSGRAPGRSR